MSYRITRDGKVLSSKDAAEEIIAREKRLNEFATFVYEKGDGKPSSTWLTAIKQFALTDFGSKIINGVLAEYAVLKSKGIVDKKGSLTDKGEDPESNPWPGLDPKTQEGFPFQPFKLVSETYARSRGSNKFGTSNTSYRLTEKPQFDPLKAQAIQFKAIPFTEFKHSKQDIFYPAILAHEFAHTRYGDTGVETKTDGSYTPTVLDKSGSDEIYTIDAWENPIRLMYGYKPRFTYHDLGSGKLLGCSLYKEGSCP